MFFKKTKNGNMRTIEFFGFKYAYDRNKFKKNKIAFGAKIKNAILGGANRISKNASLVAKKRGNLVIGEGTDIGEGTRIVALGDCKVTIGKNCRIGGFNSLGGAGTGELIIGDNVLMASNIETFLGNHVYEDINTPIMHQPSVWGKIEIGDETWIGGNVNILPNVKIGKHCVIGNSSVVTKSVPDYSVAVGNPAKVIKKYDFNKKEWVKI